MSWDEGPWTEGRRGRFRSALVLDDEPERREMMREGLLEHGVVCDEAATLEEAIRHMVVSPYDLVVCDMVLCEPPGAANPAMRGYLAACFALSRPGAGAVVQASSVLTWTHPGALMTHWRVEEVADLVYGGTGIPLRHSVDGGCPLAALRRITTCPVEEREEAVEVLAGLPIVRQLEALTDLAPVLGALEDAARGDCDWQHALAWAWRALFPGGCRDC
jgi:hypothetical protein